MHAANIHTLELSCDAPLSFSLLFCNLTYIQIFCIICTDFFMNCSKHMASAFKHSGKLSFSPIFPQNEIQSCYICLLSGNKGYDLLYPGLYKTYWLELIWYLFAKTSAHHVFRQWKNLCFLIFIPPPQTRVCVWHGHPIFQDIPLKGKQTKGHGAKTPSRWR